MNKHYAKISFTLLGLLVASLLVSCGESNNLADPSAVAPSACKDLGVVCVTGRFIDDPVANLDYECDKLVATTETDGSFACPINSTVTFLIKNPDDKSSTAKKITLGSVQVKSPANLGASVTNFFFVTPASLSSDTVAQKNIVRLLHALSDDTTNPDLTGYIINLSDIDKKKLSYLGREIKAVDFSLPIGVATPLPPATPTTPASADPGSFDELVEPLLAALSPARSPMLLADKAAEYLQRGINSTFAGVYTNPLGILGTAGLPTGAAAMTGSSATQNKNMIATIWGVVDRKGRVMSAGTYSYEPISTSGQLLTTNPKAMEMTAFGTGVPLWPNSGNLVEMIFTLMDENNAQISKKLEITQGKMERDGLAGTDAQYKNLFDEPKAPVGVLGRWKLTDTGTSSIEIPDTATQFTLVRTAPAAAALNPDLWVNSNLWGTHDSLYPHALHVQLSFFNSDTSTPSNPGCDATGCRIGAPIFMTILQDGNIVSDINADCSVVNPVTLVDANAQQELPLGLVQHIFKSESIDVPANKTFMTLALILPNKPLVTPNSPTDDHAKYLRYAQLMTNFGRITVMQADVGDPDYLKLHSVTSATQADKSVVRTYNSSTAGWSNYLTFAKSIDSDADDRAVPQPTSAQTILYAKNSAGYVRSAPAACPP